MCSSDLSPPKTPEAEETLWEAIRRLEPLDPTFVSVTYGAGGSTRERTHATVRRIRNETGLEPAAHLTCVGASKAEVDVVVRDYWDAGIRHLVALRGDPPAGPDAVASYTPHPEGYAYATDLVAGVTRIAPFELSVAAYPETHPTALSPEADLDNLKRKIDAGATRAITQFFFEPATYLKFLERVRAAGITVPIVPGILPVTNFTQVKRIAAACGTAIPASMAQLFENLDQDPETRNLVSATHAHDLCRVLLDQGVTEFHFYTLNRADLTTAICHLLGVRGDKSFSAL